MSWHWAKEADLKIDDMMLAKDEEGYTVLYVAAQENHVEILQTLWVWAEET